MPYPDKPSLREAPEDARIDVELSLLVRRAAHALDPVAAFAEPGGAAEAGPERARADDLARLRATEALREALTEHASQLADRAGSRTDATVTYADLGDAVGITRQAARTRWPHAIPDARPGRPSTAALEVYLTGGPPAWAGSMQAYPRNEVMRGPLEDVGAYLTVPGDEWPEDLPAGPDWRAHYAPESENTRTTWVFQGWVES